MVDKSGLRLIQRTRRQKLSPLECSIAADQLFHNLKPLVAGVNTLAIYFAANNEISLSPLIDFCLRVGKRVCVPLAYRDTRQLKFELLEANIPREIFTPLDYTLDNLISVSELELVILPLLAADLSGYRLGQGGGYYDATFADIKKKPLFCGVGYDWQLLSELPHDEWDLPLNYFVSDKRILTFGSSR